MRSNVLWLAALALVLLAASACTGGQFRVLSNGWTALSAEWEPAPEGTDTASRLYVGTREGEVLALDPRMLDEATVGFSTFERPQIVSNGLVWSFKPDYDDDDLKLGGVFGPPAIGPAMVYVGFATADGESGALFGLRKDRDSLATANLLQGEWKADLEGKVVGGPTFVPDLSLVLVGTDAGVLYGFDADSGSPASWVKFPATTGAVGPIWSTPRVVGSTAYFGSLDHNVYAVDLSNGTQIGGWPYETSGGIIGRPLLIDDQLVVGSFDRNLHGINVSSGVGRVLVSADKWFWAGAATDGSNTFVSSLNGQVFVLDRDGNKLQEFAVQGPVVAQPATIQSGGRTWVVMANEDGALHLISEGEQLTDLVTIEGGSRIKAPLVGVGRELFLSKEDGMVWALQLTGNTLEKLWSLDTTT